MNERVLQILQHFRLSQTEFARRLGIGTANLSHILNQRNKPGAEFFEKLTLAFPEISLEWLIAGMGNMLRNPTAQLDLFDTPSPLPDEKESRHEPQYPASPAPASDAAETPLPPKLPPDQKDSSESKGNIMNEEGPPVYGRKLTRIILVYSDHTFEVLQAFKS